MLEPPKQPAIRDEILIFAHALENQMRYNEQRGKGDEWRKMDPKSLFNRLKDEVNELQFEILFKDPQEKKVRHESLDVSAIAFFIWYTSLLRTKEKIKREWREAIGKRE